jgi:Flp pilus assembly pilin Flp
MLLRKGNPMLKLFGRDTRGASAIEYALIASVLALILCFAMSRIEARVTATFANVAADLNGEVHGGHQD